MHITINNILVIISMLLFNIVIIVSLLRWHAILLSSFLLAVSTSAQEVEVRLQDL